MVRTLTLLSALAVPLAGYAQGKLEAVREAVDTPRSSNDSKSDDSSMDSGGAVVGGSSGGPNRSFWDTRFAAFPYAAGPGYLQLDNGGNEFGIRASVESGSDFDGLSRIGFKLFLDTETSIGLKTDWDYFSERLPCGCWDSLWLGDVTPTFRVIGAEDFQIHVGVGVRMLLDRGRDRAGINGLIGFDAFPVKPLHLFGSFEPGTLGNADVYRLHGGIGANWSHCELFAGYDFLRIGSVNLQGPFVGLRLWY